MLQIRQTVFFRKWLMRLEDRTVGIQAMNRSRRAKSLRTVPFDAAEYPGNDETQLAYLNAVLAEGDAQAMVAALGTVARARGMSGVAKRTGLGRESLYKALSDSGNPAFTTIVGVVSALGYTFEIKRHL